MWPPKVVSFVADVVSQMQRAEERDLVMQHEDGRSLRDCPAGPFASSPGEVTCPGATW